MENSSMGLSLMSSMGLNWNWVKEAVLSRELSLHVMIYRDLEAWSIPAMIDCPISIFESLTSCMISGSSIWMQWDSFVLKMEPHKYKVLSLSIQADMFQHEMSLTWTPWRLGKGLKVGLITSSSSRGLPNYMNSLDPAVWTIPPFNSRRVWVSPHAT